VLTVSLNHIAAISHTIIVNHDRWNSAIIYFMPQLEKGGKFVFGWCRIRQDGGVLLPPQARQEYNFNAGDEIILLSGSRTSGGFGITRKSWLEKSKLSVILSDNPGLADSSLAEGQPVTYKGRNYCRFILDKDARFFLSPGALEAYNIKPGDSLISIRSSDIAIGMAAKGPLIAISKTHPEIEVFQ
jgi:hypothetical protein